MTHLFRLAVVEGAVSGLIFAHGLLDYRDSRACHRIFEYALHLAMDVSMCSANGFCRLANFEHEVVSGLTLGRGLFNWRRLRLSQEFWGRC